VENIGLDRQYAAQICDHYDGSIEVIRGSVYDDGHPAAPWSLNWPPGEDITTWGGCFHRLRAGRAPYETGSSTLLTMWWRTFLRFRCTGPLSSSPR
jgi:hypothetical protein